MGDDRGADSLGVESQALVGSAGDIVFVVGGILVLLRQKDQERWDNLAGGDTGKVVEWAELILIIDLLKNC